MNGFGKPIVMLGNGSSAACHEKGRDFLDTMLSWPGMPTERQRAWLRYLCRRYGHRP